MKTFFRVDGCMIEEDLIELFSLKDDSRDIRYSKKQKTNVLNFVGMTIEKDNLLISFPKNYISTDKINELTKEDIKLVMRLLFEDVTTGTNNLNLSDELSTNFPFYHFNGVYNYYKIFGLYSQRIEYYKEGIHGRISWKETINKSNKIINKKGVFFNPIISIKSREDFNFISECMIYIINSTLDKFSFLFDVPRIPEEQSINISEYDTSFILSELHKIKSRIFKDNEKKLLFHIIEFFSSRNTYGVIEFKYYNFNLIWERVVNKYLNDYFIAIIEENDLISIKLSEKKLDNLVRFKKVKYYVDTNNRLNIQPDHHYIDGDIQYLFDSKYYTELDGLDYKQISYFTFLKNQVKYQTYNVLILPSNEENKFTKYFEVKNNFHENEYDKILIFKYELNVKKLIKNYLNFTPF